MTNLIKIDFYPDLMDKITSFHLVDKETINFLNEIKSNKKFLIEKFYRVTKNNYKSLSSDNLDYSIITENDKIKTITNFVNLYGNNTDILELIKDNFNSYSTSEEFELSDDDLTDSINIAKILELKINNKQDEIDEIYNKNPHLKSNDTLEELIYSE